MEEFLMNSKVDFAFKKIMYDETPLKGFIAATMELNVTDIHSVAIQTPICAISTQTANRESWI